MGMRADGLAPRIVAAAQEAGLIVRASAGCVVVAPPLIIRDEEIEDLFDRLEQAFASVGADTSA